MRRTVRMLVALTAALGVSIGFSGIASASTELYHGAKVRGATGATSTSTPLVYQGGAVETAPVVYIDFWGHQWVTKFSTGGYSSTQAQQYTRDFFNNVGGTGWANTDTQYCQHVATGSTNCSTATAGNVITNNGGQLKGVLTHDVTLPKRISQSAIANEALWLMANTGGYNPNATYFVYTPSGHSMSGFGSQWCAWHSMTTSNGNQVAYAYMPYQPDAGTSCGMNFINANDPYGHGYFDGFSIVGGHEYAEAVTDPHTASGSYAWEDSSGSEIGDKCAWDPNSKNLTTTAGYWAVQTLFSNAGMACVMSS